MSKYKKCRIISIIFFLYFCIYSVYLFTDRSRSGFLDLSFFHYFLWLSIPSAFIFDIIGVCSLNVSKMKKVLFVIAHWIVYIIIIVILAGIVFAYFLSPDLAMGNGNIYK